MNPMSNEQVTGSKQRSRTSRRRVWSSDGAKGAVAAGHPLTVAAAERVLVAGGNAYDAIIAAHFAACVVEPVLASLGGGGFLLVQATGQEPLLFDFFVQTPRRRRPATELDFEPIVADFGAQQQEFHIGLGSIATPGAVKGMFAIHRHLGSLPMAELVQPAIEFARRGIRLNSLQAQIFSIIAPILLATPASRSIFQDSSGAGVIAEGHTLKMPQLADTLECLALEGDGLFYRGELAGLMASQSQAGGHLTREDLANYEVVVRKPLVTEYRGHEILTNPPPSSGGILVNFALQLWQSCSSPCRFGSHEHLARLVAVMEATNQARVEAQLNTPDSAGADFAALDATLIRNYAQEILGRARANRGTTHISVIDAQRNVATMTVSNGEGCGAMVPDSGFMLNNMLGEEDLNPGGFHQWQPDQRMTSMMAPTIMNLGDGATVALGSGGSNRIRTAILQTIINLVDFNMPLATAVASARIHFENSFLNIEPGYRDAVVEKLAAEYPGNKRWDHPSLFFGGVHAVQYDGKEFTGTGDTRRGGVAKVIVDDV